MRNIFFSRFGALVLLAAIALPACSNVKVESVWDTQFDFTPARTYDWAAKEAETGEDLPYDVVDRALKAAVAAEMTRLGYTQSSTNPTLRLTYYVGVEEVTRISNDAYYGPGWGAYWGYGWYSSAGVNPSLYDPGTITIDALSTDPSVGLVWRGVATGQLNATMSDGQVESAVQSAVRQILSDFPPEEDGRP